ncbi:methionyl-tRNA formyltransferase, partial [Patescibacteria group bacterium]|nr:methionyl-tRNA formyltransferase [Patescibacteria group bacterium]
MKRVNIVIDNPSSWFVRKVDNLIKKIKSFGFDCELLSGSEFIPENSYITFFLSCEKFINQKARDKSEFNIVIHASDLPKGRGMSPATWQILEGKNRIWITLFEVTDKIDAGDYYFKKSFLLNGTELIDEWQEKIYQCIEKITLEFIKKHQR